MGGGLNLMFSKYVTIKRRNRVLYMHNYSGCRSCDYKYLTQLHQIACQQRHNNVRSSPCMGQRLFTVCLLNRNVNGYRQLW